MLGIIKRHFINITADAFVLLYNSPFSLIRSNLEYAGAV